MRLQYKDEREIVDLAASQVGREVRFYPKKTDLSRRLLDSLRGHTLAQRERPDFEDLQRRLLVEAMIVDDHARSNRVDATRAREAAMLREVEQAGLAELFPNATLAAIADSGLPTDQDHNFVAYLRHFTRVVDKHARSVNAYREVHPHFDLAFLILDESTAYLETLGAFGPEHRLRVHAFFADDAFLSVLERSGADCVAWLAPNKYVTSDQGDVRLPTLTIIDVSEIDFRARIRYNPSHMKSTEA
ncbi:hypothetical protein [Microbacterium sp. SLBN-111]|uniref:hypothetical protein n=1 Tax=Microbacterium sp. SLBN-111 TaxID=3377733 RepID=UPI003C7643C6